MQKRPKSRGALSRLEERIGGAIERPFSRAFRSALQPAEIERSCIREVEKSRKLGIDTIYVANVYYVVMSQQDEEQFGGLLATLEQDLATRLFAHASNQRYLMNTRPIISFLVDDDFKLGDLFVYAEHMSGARVREEFGIESSHGEHEVGDKASPVQPPVPPAPVDFPPQPNFQPDSVFAPEDGGSAAESSHATVTVAGRIPLELDPQRSYTLGRHEDSDIWIPDPQASRAHASIQYDGGAWVAKDLNSTNGTLVNGSPISTHRLSSGDVIQIGEAMVMFAAGTPAGGGLW